jgi:3',5'-cyclic AMP phosphodiesterase CpdA
VADIIRRRMSPAGTPFFVTGERAAGEQMRLSVIAEDLRKIADVITGEDYDRQLSWACDALRESATAFWNATQYLEHDDERRLAATTLSKTLDKLRAARRNIENPGA